MAWLYWVAAAWLTLGVIATITQVGKERKPLTGGVAAFTAITGAGIIALLIIAAVTS